MTDMTKNSLKIYTLSIPPSPEEPFLNHLRHNGIIKYFQKEGNACHTLNSEGKVDFYLLFPTRDGLDELSLAGEEFGLNIHKNKGVDLELYYEEEIWGIFHFHPSNPLEYYSLQYLCKEKKVNIYYISYLEDKYACCGHKTLYLPGVLCYDLYRHLGGKKPLLLPSFSENIVPDTVLPEDVLLSNAWGFYLDFTSLMTRLENIEEAEEIISLHILHGLARIQRSRRNSVRSDQLVLWVGRRISLNEEKEPREYYSIYLSGFAFTGKLTRDWAAKIMTESLAELPELGKTRWISPLAEEGVPMALVNEGQVYRIDLTRNFYENSERLFRQYHLPAEDYESYYQKIISSGKIGRVTTKVYNLLVKRWMKEHTDRQQFSVDEISDLIQFGRDEDLPRICAYLPLVHPADIDEIIVSVCEKYGSKAEAHLLPFLVSPHKWLKAAAIIGLGILESKKSVSYLLGILRGPREEALLARDGLAIIGDAAVPSLAALLGDAKAHIRLRALETLEMMGTASAYDAVENMDRDKSINVERARKRILIRKEESKD